MPDIISPTWGFLIAFLVAYATEMTGANTLRVISLALMACGLVALLQSMIYEGGT